MLCGNPVIFTDCGEILLFVCNRGDTIPYHGGHQTRKFGQNKKSYSYHRVFPAICKYILQGFPTTHSMAIRAVEFSNGVYKIRKIFA
jgi:hypothetical protein